MERLKVGLNALNVIPDFTFTFQYGEIKSFNADKFASGICKFTFQYGEIKSSCNFFIFNFIGIIYIPVWRD